MFRCLFAIAFLVTPLHGAAEDLVDPMRPAGQPAGQAKPRSPAWRLDSVIVSPSRRVAVINGKAVSVGDSVGGARVTVIEPYEVELEYQGTRRRVQLAAIRVARPAEINGAR